MFGYLVIVEPSDNGAQLTVKKFAENGEVVDATKLDIVVSCVIDNKSKMLFNGWKIAEALLVDWECQQFNTSIH